MSGENEGLDQLIGRAAKVIAGSERVAALTGAGISAESGVPTFRGPGGLWRNRRAEEVATPQAFEADPKFVWEFYNYRRNLLREVEPNPGHYALAELERVVPHFTLITQNVDGLHQRAGSRTVLEVHGNIWWVRCTRCGAELDKTGERLGQLPKCSQCGGLLRPAVVWFGEALPPDVWRAAYQAAQDCHTFLVIGTSAMVQPAAGLVEVAHWHNATIIEVNLETSQASSIVHIGLYGPAGEVLPRLIDQVKAQSRTTGGQQER